MPGREEELSLVHEVSLYSAGVRTLAVWLSLFLVHEGRLSEVLPLLASQYFNF